MDKQERDNTFHSIVATVTSPSNHRGPRVAWKGVVVVEDEVARSFFGTLLGILLNLLLHAVGHPKRPEFSFTTSRNAELGQTLSQRGC